MKNKRKNIIKRVYEEGKETTIFSRRRKNAAKKQRLISNEAAVINSPAPKSPFIDNYDLPAGYATSNIRLMVKDPFWIYAYWEINPDFIESFRGQYSQEDINKASTVLRIYEVTLVDFKGDNANSWFDIEVGSSSSWYINLWKDSVSCVGEIGKRLSDGRFISLARSNCVHTPRISCSPRTEQIWMKVADQARQQPYVAASITEASSDGKYPQPQNKASVGEKSKIKYYLSEEDIRKYYSQLSPLLKDVISSDISKRYGRGVKFVLEGDSEEEKRRLLARFPKNLIKKIRIGSSEELILLGGASEQSGGSEFRLQPRDFFFELNTELIVYGRAKPDAQVWLGDKKIQLNNDGTFNLRFALPDGNLPLEFKAVSSDKKEVKKIDTYVNRNTLRRA